ncbi:hypothetical protein SAMN04488595_107150 [Ralstonia sp. 25mfcol4.1]|uniref:hypothetical protein n=1 Tax=Burkholderiaceae TaxID=119060 RepID=UPI00087EBA15|nr:hypothetical protein [Ralstonia sp. 25mfcol4.1]SDP33014.1 hypothetical protein SAMN04488595_107150 [Ralstonia sp. 25mfcol4.1]
MMKAMQEGSRFDGGDIKLPFSRLGGTRLGIALCLAIAAGAGHAESPDANSWRFAVAPYLWLPNVSGAFSFSGNSSTGGGRLDLGTGPDSYLSNLKFLFMMQAEASKGDWTVIADAAYLDFSNHQTTLNTVGSVVIPRELATNTGSSLSGGLLGLYAAYTAVRAPWGTVEPLGGLRYLNLSASANWTLSTTFTQQGATLATQGSVSQTENIVDAIIGVRGRVRLGNSDRWYLPYYLDVGTGASRYTVQASGGAAYAARWGDIQLTYRYLTYQLGSGELVQRLTLKGPMVSVAFRF